MTRQDLTAQPQLRETLDTHPHLTARNTRVSWYQKQQQQQQQRPFNGLDPGQPG